MAGSQPALHTQWLETFYCVLMPGRAIGLECILGRRGRPESPGTQHQGMPRGMACLGKSFSLSQEKPETSAEGRVREDGGSVEVTSSVPGLVYHSS